MRTRVRAATAATASLLTAAAGLVALGAATIAPATAAGEPATCTLTASSNGGAAPGTSTVTLSPGEVAPILDVDATLDMTTVGGETGFLRVALSNASKTVEVKTGSVGLFGLGAKHPPLTGIVFDDSATAGIQDATAPGTYKPTSNLSGFNNSDAAGTWTLAVTKASGAIANETGTVNAWSVTVVYDCDLDKDGVANKKDNCPTTANLDQRDSDKDGLGDACDSDADGDGVPNTGDNCPTTANADQRDMDGDGVGDVCDDDADNDLFFGVGDLCPYTPADTDTGCPEVKRTLKVKYQPKKKMFVGKVKAAKAKKKCQRGVPIRLHRGRTFLRQVRTDNKGNFKMRKGGFKGKLSISTPEVLVPLKAPTKACPYITTKPFKIKR